MPDNIDQEEKGGNVIWRGNLPDQHFLVQFGSLISKMRVIQASRGAFRFYFSLKPRFGEIIVKSI